MKQQILFSQKNIVIFFFFFFINLSAAVVTDALTLCMLGNFACFFVICGFVFKINFFKNKKSFRNTIRVPGVDPDPDPDQAPKVISRRQKSPLVGKELRVHSRQIQI